MSGYQFCEGSWWIFPCDICFKDSKVIPISPSVKVAQPTNTEPSSTTVTKPNKRVPRLLKVAG